MATTQSTSTSVFTHAKGPCPSLNVKWCNVNKSRLAPDLVKDLVAMRYTAQAGHCVNFTTTRVSRWVYHTPNNKLYHLSGNLMIWINAGSPAPPPLAELTNDEVKQLAREVDVPLALRRPPGGDGSLQRVYSAERLTVNMDAYVFEQIVIMPQAPSAQPVVPSMPVPTEMAPQVMRTSAQQAPGFPQAIPIARPPTMLPMAPSTSMGMGMVSQATSFHGQQAPALSPNIHRRDTPVRSLAPSPMLMNTGMQPRGMATHARQRPILPRPGPSRPAPMMPRRVPPTLMALGMHTDEMAAHTQQEPAFRQLKRKRQASLSLMGAPL